MIMRILNWVSRLILAGIFFYSGYVKVQAPMQFAANLTAYQLFPERLIPLIIAYLPWIEVALGILLLTGWQTRHIATATAGLLLMFTLVLTVTYLRGIDADCGCFGPGDRISPLTIARDALFLLPAFFLIVEARLRKRWAHPEVSN